MSICMHFYTLNVRFSVAPSVFPIQEYCMAAILKKWWPFLDFRWLTCFFDKIVPKDV